MFFSPFFILNIVHVVAKNIYMIPEKCKIIKKLFRFEIAYVFK
jgi:hypothetical protein